MGRLIHGGAAGVLATALMSLVMAAGKAVGLMHEAPPKEITARSAEEAGVNPRQAPRSTFHMSWLAAHVGYGAACGAVYAVIRRLLPGSAPVSGLIFGLLVWATNYLGILPALGLYPDPEEDRSSRVAVMIAAHAVYGISLGEAEERL